MAKKDIPKGTVLGNVHLAMKRPFLGGLGPEFLPRVIGKKTKKDIPFDKQIQFVILPDGGYLAGRYAA